MARTTLFTFLAGALVSVAALALVPALAAAQPRVVDFDTLELVRRADGMHLAYGIDRRSYRQARRLTIQLALEGDDRGPAWTEERSFGIGDPIGTLPLPLRGQAEVTVRVRSGRRRALIGLGGGARIRSLVLATRDARTVGTTPPPTAPPSAPTPSGPSLSAIGSACNDAFDGSRNEDACIAAARPAGHRALTLIAACAEAFDGDRNELQCIRAAATGISSARIVSTCSDNFDGDRNELSCIQTIAGRRLADGRALEVLQMCDRRSGDRAELECIRRYAR